MPPPSPFTDDRRTSLEAEPRRAYDEPQWGPETPETLGERTEARRIAMKGESTRGRADVSLDSLRERTKTRTYDKQTPDLINGLALSESPEKQQEKFDALRDVSVIMLATLLYNNPDLEKKFDLGDFANIPLLGEAIAQSNPRPAENAAFHKLRELRDHPESETSKYFSREWPTLVRNAKEISRNISVAASTNLSQTLQKSDRWTVKGFIHKHPKWSAAIAVAGAVGGFLLVRGIYRALTKSSEEAEKTGEKKDEKPKSAWGWIKWAVGGALAVFGLGYIFGWDKTLNWIKGLGEKAKDAWNSVFGEDPEFAKNKEMYARMAGRIEKEMSGEETKVAIEPKFLASLADKKYNDIVDDDSWLNKTAEWLTDAVLDNDAVNAVAKRLPGNFIYTKAQRNQYRAIRAYLKGSDRQRLISEIGIGSDATLGQVLLKLDQKLNQRDGAPDGTQPGEKGPEWTSDQVEARMLPYFKENYGTEIAPEDFRKVAKISYRDLMAGKGARAYFESLRTRTREAGAEMGVTTATTSAEQRLIDAENIVRRFFMDNESLLKSLNLPASLPAGATAGEVLLAIAKSGKLDTMKRKEIMGAIAGVAISDEEIEGIAERDELAKRLPEEQFNIYVAHKKMLREMMDDHVWVSNEDADRMIAASLALAEKLEKEPPPEKAEREKRWKLVSQLRRKAEDIRIARLKRSEQLKVYKALLVRNGGNDDLHVAFLNIQKANDDLSKAYAIQERTVAKERLWQSIGMLAGLQLPRAAYVYLSAPPRYRAFVRHYYGSLGLPTAAVARISEKIRRPSGGLALAELRVEEAERRLRGDLGGADEFGAGKLEDRAGDLGKPSNIDPIERAQHRYAAEKAHYDYEVKIRDAESKLADLRSQAEGLRKSGAVQRVADIDKIDTSIAKQVEEIAHLKRARIPIEQKAIAEAADELYNRLEKIGTGALSKERWREIDDLARRGAENNRSIMYAGEEILEDIRKAAVRGAPEAEIKALQKSFNNLVGSISTTQKSILQRLAAFLEVRIGMAGKLAAKAVRAPGHALEIVKGRRDIVIPALEGKLEHADQKHFRKVLATILHWQKKGKAAKVASENTSLLRVIKGKLFFYGLSLGAVGAVASGVGLATMDKKTGFKRAAGQAAFDIAPVTGTISDILTAVQGREVISGRKVTGFERWAIRPAFALVGAASDILLIAGVGVGMRAGLTALRGGVEVARLARLRTAVQLAGEAAAKAAGKSAAKEGAATATEASSRAVAKETADGANRILAFLRGIDKRRTVATVSLTALGIGVPLAMSFVKQDEMNVSPGLEAIAGGADGKIDDIDIEKLGEEAGDAE